MKPKEPEAPRETNRSRQKSRRKQHKNTEETTSTYSSLKVVTPSYTTPAPPSTPDQGGGTFINNLYNNNCTHTFYTHNDVPLLYKRTLIGIVERFNFKTYLFLID